MKWDNLTMSQKQALMKIYVNNGVTNLDEIVNHYNRYAEGGSKETVESPNAVMYSRTPRESVGNVVNTRPVPGLITMTEVPRIGAGVNTPITEAINSIIARRSRINTPTNVVSTDSIVTRTPVSYIGMPTRINRFDEGGDTKDDYSIDLPEIIITPQQDYINKPYRTYDSIIYKNPLELISSLYNTDNNKKKEKEKAKANNNNIYNDYILKSSRETNKKEDIVNPYTQNLINIPNTIQDWYINKKIGDLYNNGERTKAVKLYNLMNNIPLKPEYGNTQSIAPTFDFYTNLGNINKFDDGGYTKTQFDSDFYIDETDIEPVIYNKQYWYQQTPQYQEDLKNHYKQHNNSMLPFYESLKGGKYDDVYNEAINILNKEGNNNIDTAQTIYKYGTPEYEELFGMSEDYRYNNNIPIFFADDIQVPSSFRPENAYDKFVNDNIKNPMNYVSSLYNTRRAKRNIRRANRYALKHGASEYFTEFSPIEKITPTLSYDGTATYYDPNYDQISVDLTPAQSKYTLSTKTDVAHEAAHTRNLYNTTDPLHKFLNNRKDSPYYGNIYDYINSKHKKWLTPMKTPDNHDLELNESYSDLMGLRMALYDSGIVDGTKKRYRNKHIKEYLNTQEGANDRYLLLHPNIRQTRKALNRVWAEGGKIKKNKNNC